VAAHWALVEAAWSVVRQPGPLHVFYDRTRARRGHGKAIVATARKLAILFWCMLTRTPTSNLADQREAAPAGDHRRRAQVHQDGPRDLEQQRRDRKAERQFAAQAEASYKRLVKDQRAAAPASKMGASATPERA
jgi:transposase